MDVYDKIIALAKRRGFLHQSYEIYGGEAGFYDYGPLGTLLKNNIERMWRSLYVLQERCFEISTPIITPYSVLKASGHIDEFSDEIGTCKECGQSFKIGDIQNESCPICKGTIEKGKINLMFETYIGAKNKSIAFLRPETAQGIFINFQLLFEFFRKKMPFGVVQIGKGFRNEVSPRQGILRLREFSMAEAEIFFEPGCSAYPYFDKVNNERLHLISETSDVFTITPEEAVAQGVINNEALAYFIARTQQFLKKVGINPKKIRFRQHTKDEMAHYANDCWDAELQSERFGWIECVGIADRSAYDLSAHMKATGTDMRAFKKYDEPRKRKKKVYIPLMETLGKTFKNRANELAEILRETDVEKNGDSVKIILNGEEIVLDTDFFTIDEIDAVETGEKFVPNVIEPSYGIDRILYFILEHSYTEIKKENESYMVMKFPPLLAPIKVGVFPLVTKDGLPDIARNIENKLRSCDILALYDESGSIGRRYARMDEIGTPFCVTVDYQTKEDDTITIRYRDTTKQERISQQTLTDWLRNHLQ